MASKGVVSKFVEFYGEGLNRLPLADRATIANMAPEYGATCGFFPIDDETLRYLRNTGRDEDREGAREDDGDAAGRPPLGAAGDGRGVQEGGGAGIGQDAAIERTA